MTPTTPQQDAVALLTVAMNQIAGDELPTLVDEFLAKDNRDEIVLALVSLCRSLCISGATLVLMVDNRPSDEHAKPVTDTEVLDVAMAIVRTYATKAARRSDSTNNNDRRQ